MLKLVVGFVGLIVVVVEEFLRMYFDGQHVRCGYSKRAPIWAT